MRIGELSSLSGVPVATIKFYTREGLMAAGERTGYNQTSYTELHLRRLRLIRALIDVGELTLAAVRDVLDAIDDDGVSVSRMLQVSLQAGAGDEAEASSASMNVVSDLIARRGWIVEPDNPGIAQVAAVLDQYRALDRPDFAAALDDYADIAHRLAEVDLGIARAVGDRSRLAETAIVGTILGDAIIAALRRICQESETRTGALPRAEEEP